MFAGLNAERLLVSAMAVGVSDLALRETVNYVSERSVFDGRPAGSYQAVQHPLALWRAARTLKIAPVNNEMILNYIAQSGMGLPRSY